MKSAHSGNSLVASLAMAGVVFAVMQTIVIPIIGELPAELGTTPGAASWILTSTLLAGAIATPVTGRLGDMFGKRRLLLISLAILVVGSVVAALADTLIPLVVGRALQGCAAGVIPLGISLMRDELPRERLGSAMGLMSSSLGFGGALGLPIAALVAQQADWHALFWGSGVLGLIAIALIAWLVPESAQRAGGRFDYVGAAGLSVGLLCLLLAISKGGDWGWRRALILGGIAVVVLLGWGWFELRTKQPLVDLRTTARRPVLLTNLASIAFGFALYAQALVTPQVLLLPAATGHGLGQTLIVAGLVMAPGGVAMMLVSPISARISNRYGPRVSLLLGAAVILAGNLIALVMLGSVWELLVISFVISVGIALAYAAIPLLITSAVPVTETAAANGLNTLMRSIGTSSASAAVGVILAHLTVPFAGAQVPSLAAFQITFLASAGAALLALVIVAFVPSVRVRGGLALEDAPGVVDGDLSRTSTRHP